MPQPFAIRRANIYRQRARELAEGATHEWRDESRRAYMADLAATYRQAADAMSPPSPPELDRRNACGDL
jgi:hypothetical protein